MNIVVFCSQYEVAEKYRSASETFAKLLAEKKHTLVWGCGDEGLMHTIAETAQKGGARLIGVIREQIKDKAFKTADEIHIVKDAKEMNLGLIERGDIIVVLVGGIGTLNELTEVLRMRKNGLFDKRTVVLNTNDFYSNFKEQLKKMAAEGFLREDVFESIYFAETPEAAIGYIESHVR